VRDCGAVSGYHAGLAVNDALGTRAPRTRGLRSLTAALRRGAPGTGQSRPAGLAVSLIAEAEGLDAVRGDANQETLATGVEHLVAAGGRLKRGEVAVGKGSTRRPNLYKIRPLLMARAVLFE
jgi:hypothetical protein